MKGSILDIARDLETGKTTSRDLVEGALERIADSGGEGRRAFIAVFDAEARLAADAQDGLRKAGYVASPIAGIPVSVKDLFDLAGQVTRAGSVVLLDSPPAMRDAAIVTRLRNAGAILIGRTNMTEFAYSGLGLNPHYGTPGNPYDRSLIPGGSSSGAAVSVADGMSVLAVGTDTGGSARIPAALCGLCGFKPTQRRIPMDGCLPLSPTLDSIGPIASDVTGVAVVDAILAGEPPVVPEPAPIRSLTFGLPQSLVLDGLDDLVAETFAGVCRRLRDAGAEVIDLTLEELAEIPALNAAGGFTAVESFAWHADLLNRAADSYDPNVRIRIEKGRDVPARDYIALAAARRDLIGRVGPKVRGLDAMIMPTVPMPAPSIETCRDPERYSALNLLMLRNPSVVNFLDGCALSIPVPGEDRPPVGVSVFACGGMDRQVLSVGRTVEALLREVSA